MKFNWGHGLLLTIVLSSGAFIVLVILSSREKIELVTEEYYPKGLIYDEEMEKIRNNKSLEVQPEVRFDDGFLSVGFPEIEPGPDSVSGTVWIYYASDKRSDKTLPLVLDSAYNFFYPLSNLRSGRAELIIDWKSAGVSYLHKEVVIISK